MSIRPASALIATAFLLVATSANGQAAERRPSSLHFVQYGVALSTDNLLHSGSVCPVGVPSPCILGPGLGMTIRMGYRSRGPWYWGGAYQTTRHDSSNILRLAILQQLRGEVRYLFDQGDRWTPYAAVGLGTAFYGNEWGVDTGGPTFQLGVGAEYQASASVVVGMALGWRAIALRAWRDGTGQNRAREPLGVGLSQWISCDLILEIRNPLPRW